uniref:Uncharacterized protein n=1 Tax=Percolomonas cosmopolitus TaxID=63605 RepID=A0A7S1PH95_9EUKA
MIPAPHPLHNLVRDTIPIIFEDFIQPVTDSFHKFSDCDLEFFGSFVRCWQFSPHVNVKSFLRRIRRDAETPSRPPFYIDASRNMTIDNETFTFFRHVRELNISFASFAQYNSSVFSNLRGIHTLRAANNNRLTDEACTHLRGIQCLSIELCTSLTDHAFENFHGIKSLCMANLQTSSVTNQAFLQLRGIQKLDMSNCVQATITDDALRNIVGIRELDISNCNQFTDSAMTHIRGVDTIRMQNLTQITENGLRNICGARIIDIWGCNNANITKNFLRNCSHCEELVLVKTPIHVQRDDLNSMSQLFSNVMLLRVDDRFSDSETLAQIQECIEERGGKMMIE